MRFSATQALVTLILLAGTGCDPGTDLDSAAVSNALATRISPPILTANQSGVISWAAVPRATGYNIYKDASYLLTLIGPTSYTPTASGSYTATSFDKSVNPTEYSVTSNAITWRPTQGTTGVPPAGLLAQCATPCSEALNIGVDSATLQIYLKANGPARLAHGPTGALGSFSAAETSSNYGGPGNPHRQTLKGLPRSAAYFYQVQTLNTAGAWVDIGAIESFRTVGASTVAGKFPASQAVPPSSVERQVTVPSRGVSIAGDVPGTTIRSVSNPGQTHAYSRRGAWNSDETVLYVGERAYRVSDLSEIRSIASMGISTEWYPSHLDPDVIYGTSGSRLLRGNIRTGAVELIVDIGEPILLGQWEGGISDDDRYAVVDSGNRLRVVDMQSKRVISGPYQVQGALNGADISHDGNFVVYTAGNVTYIANRTFTNVVATPYPSHHADLCVDVNGDQVVALFGGNDLIFVRLRDRFTFLRSHVPNNGNGHVSCTNWRRPGWAYVSTLRGGNRIVAVKIDPNANTSILEDWGFTRQYQVSYVGTDPGYDYAGMAKVSAAPSGTQVIYSSRWNRTTSPRDFVLSFQQ